MNIWGLGGRIVGVLPKPRPALKDPFTWVAVIGAIYVLYGAWTFVSGTDLYLRTFDPEQYWTKKVDKYEQRLDTEQKLIQESRLHIQMLEAMEPFVISKAMIWSQSPSIIQEEAEYHRRSIAHEQDSIKASEKAVSEYEKKMIEAREHLARY